jgi:hypothetical protein
LAQRVLASFCLILLLVVPAAAQERAAADTVTPDTVPRGPTPRTAMIRSWLFPGWGQASVQAYTRGAFFFAAQTTSGYMLLRSIGRLGSARSLERAAVSRATDSLNLIIQKDPDGEGERLMDPAVFEDAVADHPAVDSARALVRARGRQRQDWITYTLFLTLMSGVDAFVAAHLKDAPVSVSGTPARDGGFTLQFHVPTGFTRSAAIRRAPSVAVRAVPPPRR